MQVDAPLLAPKAKAATKQRLSVLTRQILVDRVTKSVPLESQAVLAKQYDTLPRFVQNAQDMGQALQTYEDDCVDGRTLTVNGRKLINFGSCSYLGLEMDARLKAGAIDAVQNHGTQFSSSYLYLRSPLYKELESLLDEMTGGSTMVCLSTTLAHLTALPCLIGHADLVFIDQQAHSSIQMASGLLRARGTEIQMIPHSRMDLLSDQLERMDDPCRQVWYLADGIYSMYGDRCPLDALAELQAKHSNLHLYIDDAHGFGWHGKHGRGYALDAMRLSKRTIVVASMSKSFAGAGGVICCPDSEMRQSILTHGGPLTFGGPIQPPMLGALVASAKLHLTDEIYELQMDLQDKIAYAMDRIREAGLPLLTTDVCPILFVRVGQPAETLSIAQSLQQDGFWVNVASHPVVPLGSAGIRFCITSHISKVDIDKFVAALSKHFYEGVASLQESTSSNVSPL